MKDYALFYDYHTIGDVLLIVKDLDTKPDKKVVSGDVVSLYKNDKLIGINIFNISSVLKIKSKGLIVLPMKEMIDVINNILTNAEVETLDYKEESGFKIGHVLTCEEHPDSDHMHVLTVDVKDEVLDIVCGAPNVKVGQKVVVATLGTTMFDGKKIIPSELRGIKSNGMLCSPRELHLEGAPQVRGILVLDENAKIGDDFFKLEI
ncbi:MAG: DUF4479 domain-containing protein [Erysipelotrichales bacterium]|nr:DUF4479 domain-containing protein [Erysipelotrichales bacterium]